MVYKTWFVLIEGVVAIPSQGMDIPTSSVQSAKIKLTE